MLQAIKIEEERIHSKNLQQCEQSCKRKQHEIVSQQLNKRLKHCQGSQNFLTNIEESDQDEDEDVQQEILYSAEQLLEICHKHDIDRLYPEQAKFLKIAATLPIVSVTNERSFSQLRMVKDYLRSNMSQDRLSGLTIIKMNQDVKIDMDDFVVRFLSIKERRIFGKPANHLQRKYPRQFGFQ
eukprot:TRINITY_DN9835_c0_g1_i1.p1 TRINITY_DN9835_c0_g1~~TRINITY_DN9835_c0_g1_i1.p1  ORF type:complete len:210 (-),score=26.36 TRINITY_DN9835_c0_g1_i1:169-714(-)